MHAPKIRQLIAPWFCLIALASAPALAAATVTDPAQLQALLHKQVDVETSYGVIPFPKSENAGKLAHALLDGMWESRAYRDNMQAWLNTNQAEVADELVAGWNKHYHRAFLESFEFFDERTLSVLWRLVQSNSIYAMDRADCQTKSAAEIKKFIGSANGKLLAENWPLLASNLPKALAREFARQNAPKPGDRPVDAVMRRITLASFKALADSLPPDDATRLTEQYSLEPPQRSPQDRCDSAWLSSHAIHDARLDDAKPLISAGILRTSVTSAAYSQQFSGFDYPTGRLRPTAYGFQPGTAYLASPSLVTSAGAAGQTTFRVALDAAGKATGFTLLQSTVIPEVLTSIDGTRWPAAPMIQQAVEKYYRSGTFKLDTVDGKAPASSIDISLSWQP